MSSAKPKKKISGSICKIGDKYLKYALFPQITFTGVVGSSYTGDIAIDDVTITGGRCLKSTASPTPQTSSTVVSSWSSSQPTDTATSPRPSSVVTYVSPSSRPHGNGC